MCAAECNSHRSEIGQRSDSVALPASFHAVRSRHAAETEGEGFSSNLCHKLGLKSSGGVSSLWQGQTFAIPSSETAGFL